MIFNLGLSTTRTDDHQLAIPNDTDSNLLTDSEEAVLFYHPGDSDEDGNQILDGVDLAENLTQQIADLETHPHNSEVLPTDRLFKVDHRQFGIERCEICGQSINMGFYEIVNPLINQEIQVPLIAWHTMKHGAFSYQGTFHEGRVEVARLFEILGLNKTPVSGLNWTSY